MTLSVRRRDGDLVEENEQRDVDGEEVTRIAGMNKSLQVPQDIGPHGF
jgi:hypothetical protein